MAQDNAADAARILHEGQVSALVEQVRKQLQDSGVYWTLHYSRDDLLAVLVLLERLHLLRDSVQEEKDQEAARQSRKSFARALTEREKAYRQLTSQVVHWCGLPGAIERLELIGNARDDEEYQQLTRRFESDELPQLVRAWREEKRGSAEAKVARVSKLLDSKRKTVSMQALREALGDEPPY